ncbi:hypothetical protein ACS0TY_007682 [Phlomoides rotata]
MLIKASKSQKYYVVFKGIRVGIYGSWYECAPHVLGFKGSVYRSFRTEDEAVAAYTSYFQRNIDDVKEEYNACIGRNRVVDEDISLEVAAESSSNVVDDVYNFDSLYDLNGWLKMFVVGCILVFLGYLWHS